MSKLSFNFIILTNLVNFNKIINFNFYQILYSDSFINKSYFFHFFIKKQFLYTKILLEYHKKIYILFFS